MIGFTFQGPDRPAELREIPTPEPGPGEILLRMGANTVCGTDLRILKGEKTKGVDLGVVLGHEPAGYIEAVGAGVEGYPIGALAGVPPLLACGVCAYCRRGVDVMCDNPKVIGYGVNGGLAEYMLVPADAVAGGFVIMAGDQSLPPAHFALAEPLSCCLNGMDTYRVEVGDTVVIMGAGPIGMFHTQLAKLAGARTIIVSDPAAARARLALDLGATHVANPLEDDLAAMVMDLTGGLGADVAVICIGRPQLVNDALRLMRKQGRVSIFAGLAGAGEADIEANLIHYREIQLLGAANSDRRHYERAVALIESGQVNADALLTHTFPLSQTTEAIEFVASGEGVKVAVVPDSVQ
jgi:threonine dehydrogenase-like Zn-dependent dehydrogenase